MLRLTDINEVLLPVDEHPVFVSITEKGDKEAKNLRAFMADPARDSRLTMARSACFGTVV